MYTQPILKKFLPHTVKLYKSKLISKDTEFFTLDHVRFQINPPFYTDKGVLQQSGMGNYKLYFDLVNSQAWSMIPGDKEGEWKRDKLIDIKFAIGDTIKFDHYPYVSKIIKIEPIWGETNQIHHYEIGLD